MAATASCFQSNAHYYHSSSVSSLCEGYVVNEHVYITAFSTIFIILTAFYSLFFYQHNLSLLRFISSSLMFNGIASFLNHWYGTRDWLFIDNISFIISLYLLLLLCIHTFITNYTQLVSDPMMIISGSKDTRAPVSPTSPKSTSIVGDIDYAHQMSSFSNSKPSLTNRHASVIETNNALIAATRSKIYVSIICFIVMCFLIYSNITACEWSLNTNDLFIIFALFVPIVIFCALIAFYIKTKQSHYHIGTLCHSSYAADSVFKCYIRGVIAVFVGNLSRIITETACFADKGAYTKNIPGRMLYNVLSFYGYTLIIIYIMYLSNDMQKRPCFFQTLNERHLNITFVWFHWLFPSLVCVSEKKKISIPDLLRDGTLQLGVLPEDLDLDMNNMMDMEPDLLPSPKGPHLHAFEDTRGLFLQHWNKSDGDIIFSDSTQINATITMQTTQIRVVEQNEGDQSCGYYALFFVHKLSQIFSKINTLHSAYLSPSVLALMQELRSKEAFNSFKDAIMKQLVKKCEEERVDDYPWNVSHVTASGILERAYLQFLQNDTSCDVDDLSAGYPAKYGKCAANIYGFRLMFDVINLLEFSEVSLKTNILAMRTLRQLEYFFNERFAHHDEHFKIFLIGSAIHYVVCAIFRDQNHIDILYLDSQNQDILHKNALFLREEIINPMKFTSWCNHGWHLNDMRRLAKDSFKGIQFAVTDLLPNAICNIYSSQYNPYFIRDKLIKMNVFSGFLGSFNTHALQPIIDYTSNETQAKRDTTNSRDAHSVQDVNTLSPDAAGWFVFGVNSLQSLTLRDELKGCNEDDLNMAIFQEDCQSVVEFITHRINIIQSNTTNDDRYTQAISDINACSSLIKAWILSYFPASIIETNIVNILNQLENNAYDIQKSVIDSLYEWSTLVMIIASVKIDGDDTFWNRLCTTSLIVQMISESDCNKTKSAPQSPQFIPDFKELCLILKDATHSYIAPYLEAYPDTEDCISSVECMEDVLFMICLYAYHPNQAFYDNYYNALKYYCVEFGLLRSEDCMILHIVMCFVCTNVKFNTQQEITLECNRSIARFDANDSTQLVNALSEKCLFIVNNEDVDKIQINCYIMGATKLWLGFVDKREQNDLSKQCTLHCFGSKENTNEDMNNSDILQYKAGSWISFVISINNDAKYDVMLDTEYEQEGICVYQGSEMPNNNELYFMCGVMNVVGCSIFIEKGMCSMSV